MAFFICLLAPMEEKGVMLFPRWCLCGSLYNSSIPAFKWDSLFPLSIRRFIRANSRYNQIFASRFVDTYSPNLQVFNGHVRHSTKGSRRDNFFNCVTQIDRSNFYLVRRVARERVALYERSIRIKDNSPRYFSYITCVDIRQYSGKRTVYFFGRYFRRFLWILLVIW